MITKENLKTSGDDNVKEMCESITRDCIANSSMMQVL